MSVSQGLSSFLATFPSRSGAGYESVVFKSQAQLRRTTFKIVKISVLFLVYIVHIIQQYQYIGCLLEVLKKIPTVKFACYFFYFTFAFLFLGL